MNKLYKIYQIRWNSLTDEQRWKAVINHDFSNMRLVLDIDSTFLQIKNQNFSDDQDFKLYFTSTIKSCYALDSLLDALNIKYISIQGQ